MQCVVISDLPFYRHLVSLSPGSCRVHAGTKWSSPEAMQGMQCPLPARGQHRQAPGLLLGRGWTRRRSFMHVWFPLALSEPGLQGTCPCTWIPDLMVLRDKWAGNSKGQQTSVSPRECGRSESSHGVGASRGKKSRGEKGLQNTMLGF